MLGSRNFCKGRIFYLRLHNPACYFCNIRNFYAFRWYCLLHVNCLASCFIGRLLILQRLCASPMDKQRCRISVTTQYLCDVEPRFLISGQSFIPPPKVVRFLTFGVAVFMQQASIVLLILARLTLRSWNWCQSVSSSLTFLSKTLITWSSTSCTSDGSLASWEWRKSFLFSSPNVIDVGSLKNSNCF